MEKLTWLATERSMSQEGESEEEHSQEKNPESEEEEGEEAERMEALLKGDEVNDRIVGDAAEKLPSILASPKTPPKIETSITHLWDCPHADVPTYEHLAWWICDMCTEQDYCVESSYIGDYGFPKKMFAFHPPYVTSSYEEDLKFVFSFKCCKYLHPLDIYFSLTLLSLDEAEDRTQGLVLASMSNPNEHKFKTETIQFITMLPLLSQPVWKLIISKFDIPSIKLPAVVSISIDHGNC
ncbi:hypothetical protein STEG23_011196 [Scotinomys teguina]